MMLRPDFQFSQSSLGDYLDCARRFQLRYIDQVRWPALESQPAAQHEERMRQGAAFHQLLHQHALGIPASLIEQQIQSDPVLLGWWRRYLQYRPAPLPQQIYPEQALSAPVGPYRLIAKYDLLAIDPDGRAVIVDWKTSARKPRRDALAQHIQTLVYPYVLALAGADLNEGEPIEPEQIEMIYWFSEHPDQPERFSYDQQQFTQTAEYLQSLIASIEQQQEFAQTHDNQHCRFCVYRSLCDRGVSAGDFADWDGDEAGNLLDLDIVFDQIAEIAF